MIPAMVRDRRRGTVPGAAVERMAGRAGDVTAGRPAWLLTLVGGAIAQAVVAMLVLSVDRTGVRSEVSRDIVIVGVLGIVVAILVALLAPSAGSSKVIRRALMGAIALMIFV